MAEESLVLVSATTSYRIGVELGRGGQGVVSQAWDLTRGTFVAVKRVKLRSLEKQARTALQAEINLLRDLSHPNILEVLDVISESISGELVVILEFMESGSLKDVGKSFGKLFTEAVASQYVAQVLCGLEYLHDQGVLHLDVKASNLLVSKDGTVKLADFGVSKRLRDHSEWDDIIVGSPYWMAPEVIESQPPTSAADIWSLGCTAVELISGNPPYFELSQMPALYAIVADDHPPLPASSPACRDFLLACFVKEPRLRATARKLSAHPWTRSSRSTPQHPLNTQSPSSTHATGQDFSDSSASLLTRFQEAVEDSPDFDSILLQSPPARQTMQLKLLETSGLYDGNQSDEESDNNWFDDDDLTQPSGLDATQQDAEILFELLSDLQTNRKGDFSKTQSLLENQQVRQTFVSQHGVLLLLVLADSSLLDVSLEQSLKLLTELVQVDARLGEHLVTVGLLPLILPLVKMPSVPLKVAVCSLLNALVDSKNLIVYQVLVACGLIPFLVDLLSSCAALMVERIVDENKDHSAHAYLSIVRNFVEKKCSITSDVCRLFCKFGLLPLLGTILHRRVEIVDHKSHSEDILKIVVCLTLSGQATRTLIIRESMLLSSIVRAIQAADEVLSLEALRCVKTLSMDVSALGPLESAGVVHAIATALDGPPMLESFALQSLFYVLRLSTRRQAMAMDSGVVPRLAMVSRQETHPLRQFALPIVFEIASHATASIRSELRAHGAVTLFIDLLSTPYWNIGAFNILSTWLREDPPNIEGHFIENLPRIEGFYRRLDKRDFELVWPATARSFVSSDLIMTELSTFEPFVKICVAQLLHSPADGAVPSVIRSVLRVLTKMVHCHPSSMTLAARFDLESVARFHAGDSTHVLIRKDATGLLEAISS